MASRGGNLKCRFYSLRYQIAVTSTTIQPADTAAEQRVRMFRIAMAAAAVMVHLTVCLMLLVLGQMEIGWVGFLTLTTISLGGFLLLALMVLMEWNLVFEDPEMSLVRMAWAVTVVIMTTCLVNETWPLVALSGIAMVLISANRLGPRQLIVFCLYAISVYSLTVVFRSQFGGTDMVTEAIVGAVFGLVLVSGLLLHQVEAASVETTLADANRELRAAIEQVQRLAVRDELTGAFNRRHLLEVLSHEKALADRRGDYAFTLCYVDLDHFKRLNDLFGHIVGDQVLRSFSSIATGILREVDCVARIGGEEFVLVLGSTAEIDALSVTKRIGLALRKLEVSSSEPQYRVTASIGVTQYRPRESVEMTMERADRALYDAKHMGRNKIVIADNMSFAVSALPT